MNVVLFYWVMGNILLATPLKKNDSPSPSNYKLPIASRLGVDCHELPSHASGGMLEGSVLGRCFSEFMCAVASLCPEDSTSQYS